MRKNEGLLKKKLLKLQKDIDIKIYHLEETMKKDKLADIKVISTKLSCLQQHKEDIEELISICESRNRF